MIVIDKLCYHSRLRYENAGEKFAFAIITLCICVMSRSIAVAGIVLAVTGVLTVKKGGVPVSRYLRFLTAPIIFLLLSTIAIMFHLAYSHGYVCCSCGKLVHYHQLLLFLLCGAAYFYGIRSCFLPVFFILYYADAGYFAGS